MAFPGLPTSPADACPWAGPGLDGEGDLPAAAEVAVVGGGLVALRVAAGLARAGARVVLLAPDPDLSSAAERGSGLVLGGWDDNAWRLTQSLGAARARELVAWTDRAAAVLRLPEDGLLVGALKDSEATELTESAALRRAWGLPGTVTSAAGWAGAVAVRGGAVDPWALAVQAAAEARAAGARLVVRAPVHRCEDRDGAHVLHHPAGTLTADLVVLCGDHRHARAWPWLGDKLRPVRHQLRHHPGVHLDRPVLAQFGYLVAAPGPTGVLLGGCRWATPHLEEGEDDASVVREVVDQKIGALWQGQLVDLSEPPAARWSVISTHTCDGLPLIGPLPGAPTLVACCGFNGRPHSHALPAADAVLQGILDGRAEGVPGLFRPDRFVGG